MDCRGDAIDRPTGFGQSSIFDGQSLARRLNVDDHFPGVDARKQSDERLGHFFNAVEYGFLVFEFAGQDPFGHVTFKVCAKIVEVRDDKPLQPKLIANRNREVGWSGNRCCRVVLRDRTA